MIAENLDLLSFKQGEVIVRQGDVADSFYIVRSGLVVAVVSDDLGNESNALYEGGMLLSAADCRLRSIRAEVANHLTLVGAEGVKHKRSTSITTRDSSVSDTEKGVAQQGADDSRKAGSSKTEVFFQSSRVIGKISTGGYFGETALLYDSTRNARLEPSYYLLACLLCPIEIIDQKAETHSNNSSVIAESDVQLLQMRKDVFESLVRDLSSALGATIDTYESYRAKDKVSIMCHCLKPRSLLL